MIDKPATAFAWEVIEIRVKEETRRERNRKKADKDALEKDEADSGSFVLRN